MIISPVHFPMYRFWPRRKRGDTFFDRPFYFARGSWALAYGIIAIAKKKVKNTIRVWFPDYFCKEPLDILKNFSIEIEYYPIGRNLEPDWEELEEMCRVTDAPDAIVLVHYFGFPNNTAEAKKFCEGRGIELIEDCAHVMAPYQKVGTMGTVAVFSPWKFFPLPLLGALQVREDLRGFVSVLSSRREVISGIRWHAKRAMQGVLCAIGINWYARSHNALQPPLNLRGGVVSYAFPNTLSLQLFHKYIGQADYICARRIENYRTLTAFLNENYPDTLLVTELPDGTVPYFLPCLLKGSAKHYVSELTLRGVPAG